MRKLLALAFLGVIALSGSSLAASNNVTNKVGVCDPNSGAGANCLKPNSDGSINTVPGSGTQNVQGTAAVGGTPSTNPLANGCAAVSSEPAATTTTKQQQMICDLVGKLIVLPYANPENFVSGVTAAMTATTSTSLIAAPAGSLRNYVTQLFCANSHATVSTFVIIQDGSGGTTIYEGYALAAGGGFSINFTVPLRQPTAATALFVANVTTGANVICAAAGYKGL